MAVDAGSRRVWQQHGARGGRRRGPIGRLVLALPVVLLIAGFAAAPAQAEEPTVSATFTCLSVTYTFTGFPNLPNNEVSEVVRVNGGIVYKGTFTFNGPSGSNTIKIVAPPGKDILDALVSWNTNGVKGSRDISKGGRLTCGPERGYTIEKEQRLQGVPPEHFTAETIHTGHVGQVVEYKIVVTNTGEVPQKFGPLTDPNCENITGGTEKSRGYLESTTYFCQHTLNEADREAIQRCNTATITATPPEEYGPPTSQESNTVCVEVPTPENEAELSCKAVTFTFFGFPNVANNVVTEVIRVDGKIVYKGTFTFNGPSGSNTITLSLTPGFHIIDALSHWNTHGYRGSRDISKGGRVTCE